MTFKSQQELFESKGIQLTYLRGGCGMTYHLSCENITHSIWGKSSLYDAYMIAKNTGISVEKIQRNKSYLMQSNNPRWSPDPRNLIIWYRMTKGDYPYAAEMLTKHESLEMFLKEQLMLPHKTAHYFAECLYDVEEAFFLYGF